MAEQCDWWQCWDENEGFHYYQHRLTYESQWHAPDNWGRFPLAPWFLFALKTFQIRFPRIPG